MSAFRNLCIAALLSIAVEAGAQSHIELGPLVGYYRPLSRFDPASVYSTALPERPQDLAGLAIGGEARLLWSRFGIAVRGMSSRTFITEPPHPTPSGGGRFGDTPARVTIISAEALVRVAATNHGPDIRIGAGPAWIQHSERAYESYGSPSQVALSMSAAARWRSRSHVRPFAGVSLTRYLFDVPMLPEASLNPGSMEHGVQLDALLHAGVSWSP